MSLKRLQSDSFPGLLSEARAASTAGGGTSLTTGAVTVAFPNGTSHVVAVVTTFAGGALVVKFALCPYLLIMKSTDTLATVTDYSIQGQQPGGSGTVLSALPTLANGGEVVIGSHLPFRGVDVTNANANGNASTLAVHYWNGTVWTAVAGLSDGTNSGGKTQAQNGQVTWTVPTDWVAVQLPNTRQPAPTNPPVPPSQLVNLLPYSEKPRFWTRWTVSAALSATVKNSLMIALNRSTAYAELISASQVAFRTGKEPDGLAGIELLTDQGTAKAIVNVYNDTMGGGFTA